MLKIHLITLGKLKETYWREAEAEYLKRLRPYAKIFMFELREESFSEKDNREIIKQKEAKKISDEIDKIGDSFIVALDEHGKKFSSVQLADQLHRLHQVEQHNNITLIIGGPLGLDKTITDTADLTLSLSNLTFTHQMARVILLEQIYRAMMITQNRPYHY